MNFALLGLILWCINLDATSFRAREVISRTSARINGSQKVTIEIVMTEGRFFDDQVDMCVSGEKWEGQFEIRVLSKRKVLSKASLNQLLHPETPSETLFFWAPKFKLALRDYNRDGRVDFNIFAGYMGSMYNKYRIFTILRDGSVKELPVDHDQYGDGLLVSGANHINSTRTIKSAHGLMSSTVYDRGEDGHGFGFSIEEWAWKRGKFVLTDRKPGDWPLEDQNVR